jgi:hypothetical protein
MSRRATLLVGGASVPCLLQNFSGKGFFIISNQQFAISETCVGTKIMSISEEGRVLLQQFLQEYYSLKLDRSI